MVHSVIKLVTYKIAGDDPGDPPGGQPLGRIGGSAEEGFGPFANFKFDVAGLGGVLDTLLSSLIGFLTIMAGLWFMIRFILAAFSYMTADGDKQKTEQASQKITGALVGLILVIAAWSIVGLVGKIFGLDILNPADIIGKIGPGN